MKFNGDRQGIERIAGEVRLLLLDVDGVLTDGRLYYSGEGEVLKVFNSLDGHGIKLLMRNGIEVGIISGRDSPALDRRVAELGIELLYKGREDKTVVLQAVLQQKGLPARCVAFAGDDLPDLGPLKLVGLPITVPNAHVEIRKLAALETENPGGRGAVREICDFLLRAQGRYEQLLDNH